MRLAWIVVPLCLVGSGMAMAQDRSDNFGARSTVHPQRPTDLEVAFAKLATQFHCKNTSPCFIEVEVEDRDVVEPVTNKKFTCMVSDVRPAYFFLQGAGAIRWQIVSKNPKHQFPEPPGGGDLTDQTGIDVVGNDPSKHFERPEIEYSRLRLQRRAKGMHDRLYHYNIQVVRTEGTGDVPCLLHDPIIINRP
jgi:hypothetical protein